MDTGNGPNLYVLGAPRAGTTFLHSALSLHPDIFAPPVKEPHFHLRDVWQLGGPEQEAFTKPIRRYLDGKARSAWGGMVLDETAYRALFAQGRSAKYRLDGTPNYFREADQLSGVINDFVSEDVYAIAVIRDPVDRIVSHYRLFRQLGWESLAFEDAILAGPDRVAQGWAGTWDYVRYSQYSAPAQIWKDRLGNRFRLYAFDDLAISPKTVFSDIHAWLGISTATEFPAKQFNAAVRYDDITREDAEKAIDATARIDLARERSLLERVRLPNLRRPKVTIGVPVRNGAATIAASIESLQKQSYKTIEIVVCDNASTDDTAAIVREISSRDPRVILRTHDRGVDIKQSYERALKSCSGDYFMFAPADDRWNPDFIATAVGRLQGNPQASVCCGRIELFDDNGNRWSSGGLRPVRGSRDKRWRRALLQMDASRLYGVIRSSALSDLFPKDAPEGWDHFAAAKLAWHGEIEAIDMIAMHRHQTPMATYRRSMFKQEKTFWGRVFFMRHVARMFVADRGMNTASVGARLALWAFVLGHANLALRDRGPVLDILRRLLKHTGRACAALSKATP